MNQPSDRAPNPLMKPPRPNYLSTGEVAKRLTVSRQCVVQSRKLQKLRIRDANGYYWYDAAEIERFRLQRDAKKARRPGDPPLLLPEQSALAARAFELWECGRSLAEVVIALQLHPAAAKKMWDDWTEFSDVGREVKRKRELQDIAFERQKAQARTDGYRDYNASRVREKELSLDIARERRIAAQYGVDIKESKASTRAPLSPREARPADVPADAETSSASPGSAAPSEAIPPGRSLAH